MEGEGGGRVSDAHLWVKFSKNRKAIVLFCLVRKIIREHCTTIPKTTFNEISLGPWKCLISFKMPKSIVDVNNYH